ncbi:MAG: hypothetical protein KF784_01665 [Fimbriimonadaceae bacterium]|nr:hypothetical protein [Fimbriimonadaceae bacterium]
MLQKRLILALALAIVPFALIGCSDSASGGTMPDNKEIRKENPDGQRPVDSAGGASSMSVTE